MGLVVGTVCLVTAVALFVAVHVSLWRDAKRARLKAHAMRKKGEA